MMCCCLWPLYGFSQTSQSTLVVLGPAETTETMQTAFNYRTVEGIISNIFLTHGDSLFESNATCQLNDKLQTCGRFCVQFSKTTYFVTLLTSGSASRCESPTTNTRFLWTTRTLARCLRFSVTFCFFSFCFCFFSFFILWMSSCDRGLYTAGSSGYGYKNQNVFTLLSPGF